MGDSNENESGVVLTELSFEEIKLIESQEQRDVEAVSNEPQTLWESAFHFYQKGEVSLPSFKKLQPWSEFFSDFGNVSFRADHNYSRFLANTERFSTNYMVCSMVVPLYGILVSPWLLACFLMVAGLYKYKNSWCSGETKVFQLFGREWYFGDREKILLVAFVFLAVLISTGSLFVILLSGLERLFSFAHRLLHIPQEERLFLEEKEGK